MINAIDCDSIAVSKEMIHLAPTPDFLLEVFQKYKGLSSSHKKIFLHLGFQTKDSPLSRPPPDWMTNNIKQDLAPFSGCSASQLKAEFTRLNTRYRSAFGLISIKNNKASYLLPSKHLNHSQILRAQTLTGYFNSLQKIKNLPDMQMLILLEDGYTEQELIQSSCPLFAFTKPEGNQQFILIPDGHSLRLLNQHGYGSYNWKNDYYEVKAHALPFKKTLPLAFWRGRLTDNKGKSYDIHCLKDFPRGNLIALAKKHPKLIEAKVTEATNGALKDFLTKYQLIDPGYKNKAQQLKYRYHIVADGVSCTYPGFHWRLLSPGVVLKQSSKQVQWFYNQLKPYIHYIPVKNDFSDLPEKLKYLNTHPQLAKEIACQSTLFAEKNLGFTAIAHYTHHLLSSYSKLFKK